MDEAIRQPQGLAYVRYESGDGDGLFRALNRFVDLARVRTIRVSRKTLREAEALAYWLHVHTPVPAAGAYRDDRSRAPITWYKATAPEHVCRADLLCALLNREGMNIRRIVCRRPGRFLWQDDVQAITRRPRASQRSDVSFLQTRFAARKGRQARRRLGNLRAKVRGRKSGS